tara:strand:- start:308 stop:871 length:564 start_codon:yes stop_codon:yes gene_type:complete
MSKIFDKGYNILDIPEKWSFDGENVNEYEDLLFDDNWYWKCKIQKNVKNNSILNIFNKYEPIIADIIRKDYNIDFTISAELSLTSIIYYDDKKSSHDAHKDYGIFTMLLNDNSPNCLFYLDETWKLMNINKNSIVIFAGEELEKICDVSAIEHKVEKPENFCRFSATRIVWPKNKKNELANKKLTWI